jgi:hypothetical protein
VPKMPQKPDVLAICVAKHFYVQMSPHASGLHATWYSQGLKNDQSFSADHTTVLLHSVRIVDRVYKFT